MNVASSVLSRLRAFFGAYVHEGAYGYVGFIALGLALDLLSLPPGPLPLIVLIADAPLLWVLFHRGGLRWKRWTFLYGALHFGFAVRWLAEIHPIQVVGVALTLAPIYLLLGAAIRLLVRRRAPFVFAVGLCVVGEEMLRTIWMGGMPWPARSLAFAGDAPLGSGLNALLPAASVFGAYSFSFLAGATSALFSLLAARFPRPAGVQQPQGRRLVLAALFPVGILLVLGVFALSRRVAYEEGVILGRVGETDQELIAIQGNVSQSLKHKGDTDSTKELFDRHVRLTAQALEAPGPDGGIFAILWPETMIPWSFQSPDLAARFPERWGDEVGVMRRLRTDVPQGLDLDWLIGAIYQFRRGEERHVAIWDYGSHDSLFHVTPSQAPAMDDPTPLPRPEDPEGAPPWIRGRHDKAKLVPGGEYTPLGEILPPLRWFRNLVSVIPELDPGSAEQTPFRLDLPLRSPGKGAITSVRAGTVICFEVAFPARCRAWRRRGAEVLLNAANYGWFGQTGFRDQVQAVARLRAAELAVTVVMAGNTGPTAFYDPLGRTYGDFTSDDGTSAEAGTLATTYRQGWARAPLWVDDTETAYVRFGDWPWLGLAVLLLILTSLRRGSSRAGVAPSPGEGIG